MSHHAREKEFHECRRKTLYGGLRQHLGEVFRRLAMQKKSRVEEGHLSPTNDDIDPLPGDTYQAIAPSGTNSSPA